MRFYVTKGHYVVEYSFMDSVIELLQLLNCYWKRVATKDNCQAVCNLQIEKPTEKLFYATEWLNGTNPQ